MMTIAIQTSYSNCLFRSRLEARWAVFFDYAEIKWLYEPEGFIIKEWFGEWHLSENDSKKWNYLPDFYLPDLRTWVEVKPNFRDLSDDYLYMLQCATDFGGQLPHMDESEGTTAGLLLLSSIPNPNGYEICHPILQHHKGGFVNFAVFEYKNIRLRSNCEHYFDASWGDKSCIREPILKIDNYQGLNFQDYEIKEAYIRARKSRFEHGETL